MRPVVIVLLDPTTHVGPCFFQAAILRRPHFFLLQAAMEPFDVAVALRVMIRRAAVRDAEPVQGFDEPERSELGPIIGGQSDTRLPAARGKPFENRLLDRVEGFFGAATMRK